MKKSKKYFILLFTILVTFVLILKNKLYFNKNSPNISKINVDIKIIQLDKQLHELKIKDKKSISLAIKNYKKFNHFFFNIKNDEDNNKVISYLEKMLKNKTYNDIYKSYKYIIDINKVRRELIKAFKYIKYYFPNVVIPTIYTFNTGMDISILSNKEIIVIDPGFFIGNVTEFKPSIPDYIIKQYNVDSIVPKIILQVANLYNKKNKNDGSFIAECIFYGKALYFTKTVLPKISIEKIIGYTKDQKKYISKNSKEIWNYFIEHELLYNKSKETKRIYISESPFTSTFGKKCPGKIGIWLGYKIVESYFINNNKPLNEIMVEKNLKNLFIDSYYNP